MALRTNEGTVCDAVVRYLEARIGIKRSELWHPESRNDREVELAWKLGDQQFVLEHTVIEPFEHFLRLNAQAKAHFGPIVEACATLLADVLELEVPARCMQDLAKDQLAAAQNALIAYVQQTSPSLPLKRYSDYIGAEKAVTIAGVPFPFRLLRFENIGIEPRLQIKHMAPDLSEERARRIGRACEAKLPKLESWKKKGARTILVFEDNDIQLTNPDTVAKAFVPIARARGDAPDETYMVATCSDPWQLWPLLVDNKSYHELAKWHQANNVPVAQGDLAWITMKPRQE